MGNRWWRWADCVLVDDDTSGDKSDGDGNSEANSGGRIGGDMGLVMVLVVAADGGRGGDESGGGRHSELVIWLVGVVVTIINIRKYRYFRLLA